MKITSITIDRNFHVSNDDRFLMEKISVTAEVSEGEFVPSVIDNAREIIVQNFKAAYPKVEDSLNFHVVRDYSNNLSNSNGWTKAPMPTTEPSAKLNDPYYKGTGTKFTDDYLQETGELKSEKINKGTIEEQIEACTTLEELKTFKLVAEMNPKLLLIYHGKENQLMVKEMSGTI